jgi:uncharacterized protein YjbK
LKTVRYFYLIDNRFELINLDISTYLGKKDFEIEWETDNIKKLYGLSLISFKS